MNEHEKLETALDLLAQYVHANGRNRYNGNQIWVTDFTDCAAILFLAECGHFRITQRHHEGIIGYWRDEDPERKAGK